MKTAVIDIGSNSVRYAVMDESTEIAQKEIDSTVLADGLFFSSRLKADAIERTALAVSKFGDKAKRENVDEIFVFATEAVRAAQNGKELVDAVYRLTGIAVDVIDGDTEAEIGFLGAVGSTAKTVAVLDVGGASSEIICGASGKISFEKSHPLGCIRLRDGARGDYGNALSLTDNCITGPFPRANSLVGIGGTATALGCMLVCPDGYDPQKVHNSAVDRGFLENIISRFFAGENLLTAYPALTANRASVIGYGALVSLRVLDLFGLNSFTVSERDNMEGYRLLRAKSNCTLKQ